MSAINELLGSVITGLRDVAVAKYAGPSREQEYEIERQRAAVAQAEQQRQREIALLSQAQQFFNQQNATVVKITNILLITVAASLVGVIGYNMTRRRG